MVISQDMEDHLEEGSPVGIPDLLWEVWRLESGCEAGLPWEVWFGLVERIIAKDTLRMNPATGEWGCLTGETSYKVGVQIFSNVWMECFHVMTDSYLRAALSPEMLRAFDARANFNMGGTPS